MGVLRILVILTVSSSCAADYIGMPILLKTCWAYFSATAATDYKASISVAAVWQPYLGIRYSSRLDLAFHSLLPLPSGYETE